MKYLFYLGHPAHFHLFKNLIRLLKSKNHKVLITIKSKDILEKLLSESDLDYVNIFPKHRKDTRWSMLTSLIEKDSAIAKLYKQFKPVIMLGTSIETAQVGRFFGVPTFIFSEDDYKVVPYFAILGYPFAKHIITPVSCDVGPWNYKTIKYEGYQKLAYLHPKQFQPDPLIVEKFNSSTDKYYLLRFVKLKAYHDKGIKGINVKLANDLITYLKKKGKVFISSEGELDDSLKEYQIKINPSDIHHALYFAEMYIGDSQSMTVESALLGTPAIRFSDLAGKIGVLEELEHKYNLTYGIPTNKTDLLFSKIENLISNENLKKTWHERKLNMLSEKIDVTSFLFWLLDDYPASISMLKKNPQFSQTFV